MKAKPISVPEPAKIRVVVADDHPVVREGMIANVNPQRDMTVIAEASNGTEAVEVVKRESPDIVLLDLRMPGMDGLEVIAQLKTMNLPSKVIIVTTFESDEDVHRSIKAGACGYLLKDSSREEILDAIRRVNQGESYLPARIVQKMAEGLRKPGLSPRELEVLQCVATGKSNKEIGVQLFITEGTVKTHVKALLEKLGVPCRTAAIREAVRRGLLRLN